MLLTPGYWPSTYYPSSYWQDDYWPHAHIVPPATHTRRGTKQFGYSFRSNWR